jgi:hypothetical protein
MMRNDVNGAVERVAENPGVRALARLSMIAVSLVVIPLGGYLGNRVIASIDRVEDDVAKIRTDLAILTVEVRIGGEGRYRIDDAKRDFQVRDLQLERQRERLERLEKRFDESKK